MNEIIEKMKRIDDIVSDRITYEDVLPIIEWFTEEPEWEEVFFHELELRELLSELNENVTEFPKTG